MTFEFSQYEFLHPESSYSELLQSVLRHDSGQREEPSYISVEHKVSEGQKKKFLFDFFLDNNHN